MSEITDKQAVEALLKKSKQSNRYATAFADHTVVYPVVVRRANGEEEIETRTYVRAGEYVSPRRLAKSVELEKQYKDLNDTYTKSLRDAKIPERRIKVKEIANPTNFTPMYED
jgi:hypothetical protein